MTDLENLINTFETIKVEYELKTYDTIQEAEYDGKAEYNSKIELGNGIGFFNFECCFYFLDGKFVNHGVWE